MALMTVTFKFQNCFSLSPERQENKFTVEPNKREKARTQMRKEREMKTVVLTSSSSVKSNTTASVIFTDNDDYEHGSETRDSCYFPGCQKDANCKCEMCLASIKATLDLIPASNHRRSLTHLSTPKRVPKSPVLFNPSLMSTPRSSSPGVLMSPTLKSTARMNFKAKEKEKEEKKTKRCVGFGFLLGFLVLGLILIGASEFGFSWVFLGFLKPNFSPGLVRNLGERSWVLADVKEKLVFLQSELQILTNQTVLGCSSNQSLWKINKDDLVLHSGCTLYKSAAEEVTIWGWPLQTAGLLTADFSSRSFTVLSGRVTEWSDGKISYNIRKAKNSWVHQKWSVSVVQFDPNTWILEYRQTGLVENPRIISAILEFLKFRLNRWIRRIKRHFWLSPTSGDNFIGHGLEIPT